MQHRDEILLESNKEKQAVYWTIYDRYWRYILFICIKLCGNKEDGEEIMQDVFIIAFKNLGQLHDYNKLKPWLAKIAARECYKQIKKNRRSIQTDEPLPEEYVELDEDFLPAAYLEKKELRKEVLKAIDSLPAKQKEVTQLYYFADMKCEEIASLQKCSVDSVWNALYTARGNIKKKIERDNKAPILATGLISISLIAAAEETAFAAQAGSTIAATQTFAAITKSLKIAKVVTYTIAVITVAVVGAGALFYQGIITQPNNQHNDDTASDYNQTLSARDSLHRDALPGTYAPGTEQDVPMASQGPWRSAEDADVSSPDNIPLIREHITGSYRPQQNYGDLTDGSYSTVSPEVVAPPAASETQSKLQITATRRELQYPVGSSVTPAQLLSDAGITALDEHGRDVEVKIAYFDKVDFNTLDIYAVYVQATLDDGSIMAQIVIAIEIVEMETG